MRKGCRQRHRRRGKKIGFMALKTCVGSGKGQRSNQSKCSSGLKICRPNKRKAIGKEGVNGKEKGVVSRPGKSVEQKDRSRRGGHRGERSCRKQGILLKWGEGVWDCFS